MGKRSNTDNRSDEVLMQAYCDGDDGAFAELYERYRDAIYRYVYRKVPHQGRAEEITQDVFLAVVRYHRTWRQSALFRTYLYRIANNRCISEIQRVERKVMTELREDEDGEIGIPEAVAGCASPYELVEREEQAGLLHGAIRQLSDDFRLPILLELAEASREDIARQLAIPAETVKTRIFRAKSKLRMLLLGAEFEQAASFR